MPLYDSPVPNYLYRIMLQMPIGKTPELNQSQHDGLVEAGFVTVYSTIEAKGSATYSYYQFTEDAAFFSLLFDTCFLMVKSKKQLDAYDTITIYIKPKKLNMLLGDVLISYDDLA